jgi:hypothetical protein
MPTAAKLVAGAFFAALAFFGASLIIPYLPEGTQVKKFGIVSAAIGLLMGWIMSGTKAGYGTRAGMGYGLTTTALIVGWSLFTFAAAEMLDRSINLRYDGPMEAIQSMFELIIEYIWFIAKPDVIAVAVIGSLVGGWLVERTARSWS